VAGAADSVVMAGAGLGAGLLLSFLAGRALRSLLFGLSAYDPVTVITAVAVLFALSLVSGLAPALRAAKVDPMVALRYE
jgi:ABC-type antimicrobial peptide transport system permease subunit